MAINPKLLNEGEDVVVSTRTHPKALILPVLGALVVLALAVVLTRLGDGRTGDPFDLAVWAVAAVALVWVLVLPVLRWWTTTYTFTTRRFIKRSGIIAKHGRTIPINRISGVDFEIGVVDRIFRCGTLIVTDASAEGRVEVHDIPAVERVQLAVADTLHRTGERSDDGA